MGTLADPVGRLVAALGYGGFSFGLVWGDEPLIKGSVGLAGGNLATVVSPYLDADLTARDPVVRLLRRARDPVLWSPFLRNPPRGPQGGAMAEIARLLEGSGISTGATIPVDVGAAGCRAGLAISSAPGMDIDGFDARFAENGWLLRLAALSLGQALGDTLLARIRVSLSTSEQIVLKALAQGMRPREIAERLGKSEHTIRNQIVSAQQRLGANTKEQAIATALRFGLLLD